MSVARHLPAAIKLEFGLFFVCCTYASGTESVWWYPRMLNGHEQILLLTQSGYQHVTA